MIDVLYTPEFERRYKELPAAIQRKAERRETIFRNDPFNPTLYNGKVKTET